MTTPAGVCRFCGCSDWEGCCGPVPDDDVVPIGCYWTDRTHTVCSFCAPAAKAEAIALRTMAKAGYRSERPGVKAPLDFVAAFHQGFLVGWFGVSPRSKYGRNPFVARRRALNPEQVAWHRGQRAGAEASRGYQRVCGPLVNAPRKEILQGSGRR